MDRTTDLTLLSGGGGGGVLGRNARVRGDDDDQFRSQEAERESDAATLTHIDGRPFVFRRARPSPRTFNSATVAAVFLSHVHDSPPSVFQFNRLFSLLLSRTYDYDTYVRTRSVNANCRDNNNKSASCFIIIILLFYFLVDYISFSESTMKPNRLQLRRSIFRINAQSKTKNNSFPIGFGILSKLRTNIHSAQVWTICTHFICLLKISTQRRDSFVHTRKYHINVINVYIQICT